MATSLKSDTDTYSTLVIQSFRHDSVPAWIETCLASVLRWTETHGFDYRFIGNELFDRVPGWYMDKCRDKLPVAADYARLIVLREALESGGYGQAIWLDADMLVFDPALSIDFEGTCAFGRETWIQEGKNGKLRAIRNVHNAVCVFRSGCPVLPFLIQTVESMVRRVDKDRIAPQMVGPKLLTALHNIAGFPLLPQVGAMSPPVIEDLASGGGPALDLLRRESSAPPQAANLCASLSGEIPVGGMEQAVNALLSREKL